MVVYGEYLFLENFITGGIILYFTAKAAGEPFRVLRGILCSLCCGAYAFTMFMTVPPLLGFLGKTGFVLLISFLAFGKKSFKKLLLYGALFFAVTVLYGGVAIAFLSMFSWKGAVSSGGVYMPAATYLTITFAASAGALFVRFVLSLVKVRRRQARTEVTAILQLGEISWELTGFIDSGNFLSEPFTGKPVAVVRRDIMEKILLTMEVPEARYTAVPYHTVGTEKGVLDGYRIDALTALSQTVKKPVIAVCEGKEFLSGGKENGQILLPESMLERGIYADLKDNQGVFTESVPLAGTRVFLHRGKRRVAAAAFQRRGAENAAGVRQGEPGSKGGAYREESASGSIYRQEV